MGKIHKEGGAIVRPLYFDYFNDEDNIDSYLEDMERAYMLGDSLLVAPQIDKLKDGETTYDVFLPAGTWVNVNDYLDIIQSTGEIAKLTPKDTYANVYLKPGKIVPF